MGWNSPSELVRGNLVPSVLVFVLTALVFGAAVRYGMCFCDDSVYLTNNPVMDGLTVKGIVFAFTDVAQCIWMPFTYLTYMLDCGMGWGFGGMHAQSIAWHALNAALLYLLLFRLFGSRFAAFAGALLWSVHPLRVESVVWIASRKDVTSAFFLILGLHAWLSGGTSNRKWIALAFVLFLLGALAKPSIMVFPAFVLALDFLITGERKHPGVYGLAVGISAVLALFSGNIQNVGGAGEVSSYIPLLYRLLNALASVTVYLGNTVWPADLGVQCMIRYPDPPRFSATGTVLLGLIVLWVSVVLLPRVRDFLKDRDPERLLRGEASDNVLLAGFGIFFCSLVPFLGVAGFGYHAFADRFTILPSIGLSVLACHLIARHGTIFLRAISLGVLAAIAWRGHVQTGYWESNEKLMLHTLEVDRDRNAEMHMSLGVYYWEYGHDMEKVYEHCRKARDYTFFPTRMDHFLSMSHFFIEACYETGHDEEADDCYYLFRKYDYHQHQEEGRSVEFLMADLLWTLHSGRENAIAEAEDILRRSERTFPNFYITANMAYQIARARGDREGIRKALERCASVKWTGVYCNCTWAKDMLRDFDREQKGKGI